MTPEEIGKLDKNESIPMQDLWTQLNFTILEKTYWQPFTQETKEIFQKIFDKEINGDMKNASTAKNLIHDLVQYCKDEKISQTAIFTLKWWTSLTDILPQKSIRIGWVSLQNTNETVRLSFWDNFGEIKTNLRDREDTIKMQKLDDAERANAQKKEVIATEDKTNTQKKEVIATKRKEGEEFDQVIATKRKEGEEFDQVIATVEKANAEKIKTIEQLKQQLSSISKLTIEESKYAPFLLKEKGEGEATGEDEKLNGTLLGGALTNETYAKPTYLSVALDDEKIKDEQWNEITVGEYRDSYKKEYGQELKQTLADVEQIMRDNDKEEDSTKKETTNWDKEVKSEWWTEFKKYSLKIQRISCWKYCIWWIPR